ncbi:putative transporter small subunit [Marinobacterium rhizophilum]|uniref:Transporter small subunit n=1 Tax=Marinobacterium rhizophilum TaxID=420402 RepID=A0ABY5HIS3_9GAMM|nr:putative transporter small subunit [Marinobacterium rhizophilum]UTW12286.1 putative transporter small subunit [Marinobacterium rhizophilum]
MSELLMGGYILIWPVISAIVLVVMLSAIVKDVRKAKRENRDIV